MFRVQVYLVLAFQKRITFYIYHNNKPFYFQTRHRRLHVFWKTARRWDCSVSWTAPLSRSSARLKKRRTANRYQWLGEQRKGLGSHRGQAGLLRYQVPSSVVSLSKPPAVPGLLTDWDVSSSRCPHADRPRHVSSYPTQLWNQNMHLQLVSMLLFSSERRVWQLQICPPVPCEWKRDGVLHL